MVEQIGATPPHGLDLSAELGRRGRLIVTAYIFASLSSLPAQDRKRSFSAPKDRIRLAASRARVEATTLAMSTRSGVSLSRW